MQLVSVAREDVLSIRLSSKRVCFLALWLFILFVSVLDGFLVLAYRHHLLELNPQGQLLIAVNGGRVWLLLAAKFLGTVLAGTLLDVIHRHRPAVGTAVAAVVAALQFLLLLFLLCA
jgi:hypothetical protein